MHRILGGDDHEGRRHANPGKEVEKQGGENHSEVLALLYHEQTGIVGGLPVGPVTTDPFGAHGIRMYPDQDPVVLEETRRYFEKLAERFSNDLPKA